MKEAIMTTKNRATLETGEDLCLSPTFRVDHGNEEEKKSYRDQFTINVGLNQK